MKNYIARPGSTLTLDNHGERTTVELYSKQGLELLGNLWTKVATEHRMMYEVTWLGRPVIQFPTDIVVIQELLWELQPDAVIETGIAHGGSLVLSASILELLGRGIVVGVDIEIRLHNRIAIEAHPLAGRIRMVEGSSVSEESIRRVRDLVGDARQVVVLLDSNHSEAHVHREMELYSAFVNPGSYLVVHDGAQAWVWDIPRGKPQWKDDHPLAAIDRFLEHHREFRVDERRTRFGITSSPRGFLQRMGENSR